MADYKILAPFILESEGGYVNDPADRGGATNRGVTMQTWRAYCAKRGKPATTDTLKAMTRSEWEDIFTTNFWNKLHASQMDDQSVANLVVDWAWHSGVTRAARALQQELGVKADGIVGDVTLRALNARSPLPLFGALKQKRIKFLQSVCKSNPSQQKFLRGWLRRVNRIVYGKPWFTE